MPKHTTFHKLLPFAVDEEFIRKLDVGVAKAGYWNRSQFIRDAIIEKFMSVGVNMPRELTLPPHRAWKDWGTQAKLSKKRAA